MPPTFGSLRTKAISRAVGEDQPSDHNGAPRKDDDFVKTSRVRQQPRWGLRAAGVALIVVFILGTIYVINNLRSTTPVLVVAADVAQGQPITATDLRTAAVNTDSGLAVLPASQESAVIGKLAAKPLSTGDLLNADMVTNAVIPAQGQTLVGVTVALPKLPAEPLQPGDLVRIVDTPRDQDNPPCRDRQHPRPGLLHHGHPRTRQVIVNVLVPEAEANWVVRPRGHRPRRIILDSRER